MDLDAVAALGDERVDWRFKCLPHRLFGLTVREVVARGVGIFRDGFVGPVVALDRADLEHNLTTMARWCAARGLALAPHGKTTMAPALFARQLALGAWGITAANAGQARVYRAFGVRRILVANEFLDPGGLAWLRAELAADPGFEFTCWADSVEAVEIMAAALRGSRPIDVLVEVGVRGGRTGVRDLAGGLAVAQAVAGAPGLRLAGVGGYEGPAGPGFGPVAAYLGELRALAEALRPRIDGEMVVSAGGSAHFDQVAEAITGPWQAVLRSGAYLTHDDSHYAGISPLGDRPRLADAVPFRSAWRAWAQVVSTPEAGLALLGAGKRDLPYDLGLPTPLAVRAAGVVRPSGGTITALNDQHAYLATEEAVQVGDWVRLGVAHPCTVFDKWSMVPVLGDDGETVVDLVRTFF